MIIARIDIQHEPAQPGSDGTGNKTEGRENKAENSPKMLHAEAIAHQRRANGKQGSESKTDKDIEGLLGEMISYQHQHGKPHPAVGQAARTMMNKADREQSGVLGTVVSKMNLYRDPIVSRNISQSDFKISDLIQCTVKPGLFRAGI